MTSINTGRILQSLASAPAPKPAPAKEADWVNIDTASLAPHIQQALEAYRKAQALASEARKSFEDAMTLAIDPLDGERVIFGYRFGKLSLAIVPADKPRTAKGAIDLAAFKARR